MYLLILLVLHNTKVLSTLNFNFTYLQYSGMFVLLSVEYSDASQFSGLFYFHQLNIHVCHSAVACLYFFWWNIHVCHSTVTLLLLVKYSCVPQYSGLFYFYWLHIHVVIVQWLVFSFYCSKTTSQLKLCDLLCVELDPPLTEDQTVFQKLLM